MERETSTLSVIGGARAPEDIFISTRQNDPNQRIPQVAKTCYFGLEQSIGAEDGEQDNTCPDERSKRSHECILQMSTSWAVPHRPASRFILDSGASCHAIGDMTLFSRLFWSITPIGKAATTAATAATYKAHDGRVLTVAGVGAVSFDNFIIPNARCVPELGTGLNHVSVKQLAECGYLSMFGGGQCSVIEESSGKIVGKGRLHGDDGLYHLEWLYLPHDKACEEDSTAT